MKEYGALVINTVFCALVAVGLVGLTSILGPKRRGAADKGEPFETGYHLPGPKRPQYRSTFYLYAILFVVFDIEIAFLYPWAVSFDEIGPYGFTVMAFFVLVLFFGLLYAWRKGGLDWDS
jgi:NADH-quinone oxidoreductase subunit A